MELLQVNDLRKVYVSRFGTNRVEALRNVSFSVEKGEYIAIMGESGSGKTTLLNILASLDKPTSGTVLLNGSDTTKISEHDISKYRRDNLGFVFQDFNLLDTFSIRDNIYLPLVLQGKNYHEMEKRMMPIVKRLEIQGILDKFPYEVSGGQKQRTAIARALITNPQVLLADEPTGALDSRASEHILKIFEEINNAGQTILMVTHSAKAASHASRVLFIKDGEVYHQLYRADMSEEDLYERIQSTLTVITRSGERNA
jgi:putative ABC transport system ATP-binding protein